MSLGIIPLATILAIIAAALVFHYLYMDKIYRKVRDTSDSGFKKEELLTDLELPQGSNFNTFMIASWMLFFVALAFLFFQTPGTSPWYYFQAIHIASSEFGLTVFGIVVMFVTALAAFNIAAALAFSASSRAVHAAAWNFR